MVGVDLVISKIDGAGALIDGIRKVLASPAHSEKSAN